MKHQLIFLYFLNSFLSVLSQNISSQIKGFETQKPIEYVNIGIVGKNIGTVSDSLGFFKLSLLNVFDTDTLRISATAYKTKSYSIADLKATQFPEIIFMEEAIVQLKEIIISNKKRKPFQLGLKKKYSYPIPFYKKASSKVSFPQKSVYHEIGTKFRNNKAIKLDSIQLNLAECNLDNFKFRLNVYKIENEKIINILQQPIYISLSQKDALSFPKIDLTSYQIELDSDFLITIENHTKISDGSIYFLANAKFKGKNYPTYYRNSSQGNWNELKSKKAKTVAISILAFVH